MQAPETSSGGGWRQKETQRWGHRAFMSLKPGVPVSGRGGGRETEGGRRNEEARILRQILESPRGDQRGDAWMDGHPAVSRHAECSKWDLQGDLFSLL